MSSTGAEMLRMLASGVRPFDQSAATATRPSATGGPDFAAMLGQAKQGQLRTGLDVAIAPALDLRLSPEQQAALSEAADKAEAGGAQQALVMIDDMSLILDVTARQVVDIADMSQFGVLTGIDSVIRAGATTATDQQDPAPSGDANVSLLDALSRIDRRRSGAA